MIFDHEQLYALLEWARECAPLDAWSGGGRGEETVTKFHRRVRLELSAEPIPCAICDDPLNLGHAPCPRFEPKTGRLLDDYVIARVYLAEPVTCQLTWPNESTVIAEKRIL